VLRPIVFFGHYARLVGGMHKIEVFEKPTFWGTPPIKRLYEALGLSPDRSRRYEVVTVAADFNQNSVLPIGPHDLAGTPPFRKQFLDCIRGNRPGGHNSFVCFGLWFVVECVSEDVPSVRI
jgi:hypothetical protein